LHSEVLVLKCGSCTRVRFLSAVGHSVGAHTKALQDVEDSDNDNNDEHVIIRRRRYWESPRTGSAAADAAV